MSTKPLWRQREDALLIGAPLLVIPSLAYVPITISLLGFPAFSHARLIGLLLLPPFFLCQFLGLSRLALTLRREFYVSDALRHGSCHTLLGDSGLLRRSLLAIVLTH